MAWRYEFYLLVVKTIFYSFALLIRKILFSPLEDKIHIFVPPCNILYLFHDIISNKSIISVLLWYWTFACIYSQVGWQMFITKIFFIIIHSTERRYLPLPPNMAAAGFEYICKRFNSFNADLNIILWLKALSHEAIFSCNFQICVASCKKKLPRVTRP